MNNYQRLQTLRYLHWKKEVYSTLDDEVKSLWQGLVIGERVLKIEIGDINKEFLTGRY